MNDLNNIEKELITAVKGDEIAPCYLFIGQRGLTAPLVQHLVKTLIGDHSLEFNLETIPQESCTNNIVLEAVKTRPFLAGRKVVLLKDPPFLAATDVGGCKATDWSGWETVFLWLSSQKEIQSIIVIESASVDRRTSAFSMLKRLGRVIDMSMDEKDSKSTKNAGRSYVSMLLKTAGKKAENGAIDLILDQVGVDPVALSTEIDKLISLVGSRETISISDVNDAVSRHKEDEIFRLSEALLRRDKGGALDMIARLLANDIHPLAIFQTIINFLRKMTLIIAAYNASPKNLSIDKVSYSIFQKDILPNLKAFWGEPAPYALKNTHPYGLYLAYKEAHKFRLEKILGLFSRLFEMDLALKGGLCPSRVVLERLILKIIEE